MFIKIIKLFERKFTFKKINKSQYLILEHGHDIIFLKLLKNKTKQFVYFNFEINFYIIIKLLLRFKSINQLNYYKMTVELSDAKTIITASDDSINFYKLKKYFRNKKFIAIQNGYRNKKQIFVKKNNEKLECDIIFCLGKQNIDYYRSKIHAKVIPVGALRNNSITETKNIKRINRLTYISEFRLNKRINYNKNNYEPEKNYNYDYNEYKDFINSETKLIKTLNSLCLKNKIQFYIVGCNVSYPNEEKKWYQHLLNQKKVNFMPKRNYKSSYNFLFESKYIATQDSTLGYEFLARNKKVMFLSRSSKKYKNLSKRWQFGWPSVRANKGFFFTNEINNKEAERLFNNLIHTSQKAWISQINPYKKNIIEYQPGNKKLIKELK